MGGVLKRFRLRKKVKNCIYWVSVQSQSIIFIQYFLEFFFSNFVSNHSTFPVLASLFEIKEKRKSFSYSYHVSWHNRIIHIKISSPPFFPEARVCPTAEGYQSEKVSVWMLFDIRMWNKREFWHPYYTWFLAWKCVIFRRKFNQTRLVKNMRAR